VATPTATLGRVELHAIWSRNGLTPMRQVLWLSHPSTEHLDDIFTLD
jgi:hypothetical protein